MADAPIELLLDPTRVARFWANVAQAAPGECWLWQRAANGSGYGVHRCGYMGAGYTTMAHRAAWIIHHRKSVPDGLVIDHTCSVRLCCNPAHLRAVAHSINIRAGSAYRAGDAPVVRTGPTTIRERGGRFMAIRREYLADGKVRQVG